MYADHRRIQRREFKDFQPLSLQIVGMDLIDEATRRSFVCVTGPVWQRFNAATRGTQERRITALFLSNDANTYDALLFVGCDWVRRRQRHCRTLWSAPASFPTLDDAAIEQVCVGLAGRSVLTFGQLSPHLAASRRPVAEPVGAADHALALDWSTLGLFRPVDVRGEPATA